MSSNAKPVASSQRPLPLRARVDLDVTTASYRGETVWILKDPLSLEYYRLRPEQYALLQLLDGEQSFDSLQVALTEQFPTFRPTTAQLKLLVTDLFEKRLIWSTRPGQDEVLTKRMQERRLHRFMMVAKNVLFIRLPGWDPHRVLDVIYPQTKWLFHPAFILTTFCLLIASWAHVLLKFGEFQRRVPLTEHFASWETLLLLWATLSITKILHELGHALACRHFKGECHEIGLAFLIFSPCLYCDVSDSWMLKSRNQRMAIAAAGMYIECLLSSCALFLWWNTQAGLLHEISFAIFLISNITTLLFNLNPLLRLDGYYILSDWLEIPNLRSKSDQVLKRFWTRWCLGIRLPDAGISFSGSHGWLGLYGILSLIYRWCLAFLICLTLYQMLKPYGLGGIGLGLGGFSVLVSLIAMLHQIAKLLQRHQDQWTVSKRPAITVLLLISLITGTLFLPIPWHVTVPMVVQPHQAENIYIDSPGRLMALHVQPGQRVKKGTLLLELDNPQLKLQVSQLETALAVQQIEWKVRQAVGDAAQAEVAWESYQALQKELQARQALQERLKIRAPCDGTVIAPPTKAALPESMSSRQLPRWSGTPLDTNNLGCYLPTRTHILSISPSDQFASVLLIEQFHRTDFEIGQSVSVKFDSTQQPTITAKIDQIAPATYAANEDQGNNLSEYIDQHGSLTAPKAQHAYQAVSVLPIASLPMMTGMRGEAKVLVARHTAWEWGWRYLRATFNIVL